jgi:hypothetical protein
MAIEDRDQFLVRGEVQRRRHEADQARLVRAARREQARLARTARAATPAAASPGDQRARPGLFGWLRRANS